MMAECFPAGLPFPSVAHLLVILSIVKHQADERGVWLSEAPLFARQLDFFWSVFHPFCWHAAFNATLPAFRPLELSCCMWTGDAFAFTLVFTVAAVGLVQFYAGTESTRASQLLSNSELTPKSP